jgi:UDP-N-acetylglucosamine 2-epimerase (non-hydrolysing)
MLDRALQDFRITPHSNLRVMTENQSLSDLSSKLIIGVSRLLEEYKPDLVLVHGDTTTAFCSALAAFLAQIEVGHVEAGLRTNNLSSPFPEEANRQLIGRLARWHFSPTLEARRNLQNEGVNPDSIFVTGNTSVDSLNFVNDAIGKDSELQKNLESSFQINTGFQFNEAPYILVTLHRRENFGEGLRQITETILRITSTHPSWRIVLPVHPNPSVVDAIRDYLSGNKQISLIHPLPFYDLVFALKNCEFVITDSGGIQEEAVSLGKNVLVTRAQTERPEGMSSGLLELVGTDGDKLLEAANKLIVSSLNQKNTRVDASPYGDAKASKRIVEVLDHCSTGDWVSIRHN